MVAKAKPGVRASTRTSTPAPPPEGPLVPVGTMLHYVENGQQRCVRVTANAWIDRDFELHTTRKPDTVLVYVGRCVNARTGKGLRTRHSTWVHPEQVVV